MKRKPEAPARHRMVAQLACEFLAREGCSPRVLADGDPRLLFFHAPVLLRGLPPTRALLEWCVRLLRHTAGDLGDLLRGTTQARA